MGGEWGLGASLALESTPPKLRGLLSGILQQGYPVGYLLGALIYPPVLAHLGWRWLFFIGVLPALLSLFIRTRVKECPSGSRGGTSGRTSMSARQSAITPSCSATWSS